MTSFHFLKEETTDEPGELKKSIYRFLVNATFVNLYENREIKNYIMLIHTSVKMERHRTDRGVAEKLFSDLKNKSSNKFMKHLENIYKIALSKTNDKISAKDGPI